GGKIAHREAACRGVPHRAGRVIDCGLSFVPDRITSFGGRVVFVTVAGLMAAITTNIPYWNWYGFPTKYTTTYMFTPIRDYLVVGIIAAFVFRRQMAPA